MKRAFAVLFIATATAIVPITAAGAARPRATSTPSVLTCAGKAVQRPTTYVLACGDGNAEFISLHWTSWTATKASATGIFRENTCTPTCVAGKFVNRPATVSLSAVKSTHLGLLFSAVNYTYQVSASSTLPLTAIGQAGGA